MSQKPKYHAFFTKWQPHKIRHCGSSGGRNKQDHGTASKEKGKKGKKKGLIERFGAPSMCGDNGVGGTMLVGGANVPQWLKAAKKRHRGASRKLLVKICHLHKRRKNWKKWEREREQHKLGSMKKVAKTIRCIDKTRNWLVQKVVSMCFWCCFCVVKHLAR